MTNYVEELYKLCEIEPALWHYDGCKINKTLDKCNADLDYHESCNCMQCSNAIYSEHYPPFTAEKQIELIKLLNREFKHIKLNGVGIEIDCYGYEYDSCLDNFEQNLAHITTQLIKSKEIYKEKVREILE